jgi:hypothetical protein
MEPQTLNLTVGAMVLSNIATIVAIVTYGAKGVWYIAQLDHRVKDLIKDVDVAHSEIRDMKKTIMRTHP